MSLDDDAQAHEAQIWAINNRAREVVRYQPGEPNYGPEECNECGDEMHPVRRSHGFTLCIHCATLQENRLARKLG